MLANESQGRDTEESEVTWTRGIRRIGRREHKGYNNLFILCELRLTIRLLICTASALDNYSRAHLAGN
jgi:hypothetical protein